jgi:hypothetical protein
MGGICCAIAAVATMRSVAAIMNKRKCFTLFNYNKGLFGLEMVSVQLMSVGEKTRKPDKVTYFLQ